MDNNIFIAVICGLVYYIATSRIGYNTLLMPTTIVIGFCIGLALGDVKQGIIIGGTIQLVYLGIIFVGGNAPADQALATCIAIPIALKTGLSAEAAVGIAVPFGVLGVFLDQIRRTSNSIWIRKADKFAEEGNENGIFRCAFIYPSIVAFLLRFIPVFAINLVGAEVVTFLMNSMPQWIITGFSVAGGILPALGFAIIIMTIGRKELFPYFFMGFFAVAYLNINTMAAAIFGSCIGILKIYSLRSNSKEESIL